MEHICFLADVNRLYDYALGLYDLELTLLVAQQSQKVGDVQIKICSSVRLAHIKQGSSRIPSLPTKSTRKAVTSHEI